MGKADLDPYYEGFKGTIETVGPHKHLVRGCFEIISPKEVRVTELPIGVWTEDYKVFLETLIENGKKSKKPTVKDYNDSSTESTVDFTITFYPENVHKLVNRGTEYGCNALEKTLKLYTTMSTTNMHLFSHQDELKKYNDIDEIINEFYGVRYVHYEKRKTALIEKLEKEKVILANKARFIGDILSEKIDLRKKKMSEVIIILENMEYDKLETDTGPYKYLINMPMASLTTENIDNMIENLEKIMAELEELKTTTVETTWLKELTELNKAYNNYFKQTSKTSKKLKLT